MSPERKLITGMSTCLQCGSSFEAGDKFCQDCGASLPSQAALTEPASGASLGDWRERLQKWRVERVPAEVILIAAACAYMASAALWSASGSGQSHWKSAFAHFKMPALKMQMPAFQSPAKQPDRSPTATTAGAAPKVVAKEAPAVSAADKSARLPVAQSTHTDATRRFLVPSNQTQPVPALASSPSPPPAATAQPALSTRTAAEQEVAAQNSRGPSGPSQRTASKRIAFKGAPTDAAAAQPPADSGEIQDVAEYNRLLAAYFEKPVEGSESRAEPPSFSEWVAAGKPQF